MRLIHRAGLVIPVIYISIIKFTLPVSKYVTTVADTF